MSESFLTGSRVYGSPREDSDYDLVVLIDKDDANRLATGSDDGIGELAAKYGQEVTNLQFGKLNLILVYTQEEFDFWRRVTNELHSIAASKGPVLRDFAVDYIAKERKKMGVA